MPDKRKISDADRQLFREQIKGTRKLNAEAIPPGQTKKPSPHPTQLLKDERQVLDDMLSDHFQPEEVETGDELLFTRPGLQTKVIRQLRRGHHPITAELDLHGMVVKQARLALTDFLKQCRRKNDRCVRIIHGKGLGSKHKLPVLKNKVNNWLQQRDDVLAFCTARPVDGGTGAVYVLLKRQP